ncbi:hypothetical protein EV356DRAFT_474444 [Viridothelium virens]|uniref:Uncharacterized protein n=1 Tax=Viridothelium virens TaxID=1048519 RepID=A0A6A6GWI8_VIRVR|nr:hypothetical protein EV356DRAFT_474444 [Viridothelium virens]
MSEPIVFATYDIKAEQWADFTKAAAMEGTDVAPYVLVYSRSPQDTSRTNNLASSVKTELDSATYAELRTIFRNLVDPKDNRHMSLRLFLILDEQSASDRDVLIVHREPEWVKADGTRLPCDPKELGRDDRDQFEPKVAWRSYRVPFGQAAYHWLVLEEKGPQQLEQDEQSRQWLQDVELAPIEEKALA